MTKSSRRWRVTRRKHSDLPPLVAVRLLEERGGNFASETRWSCYIPVAFHSGLVFGFRLRIQIVMAGRKRSSGRNAPSGVDTVVHELNSNHKETISLVLD
ncbi:hypothetical protein HID58_081426 [Brassica napus]|uniref:Uncharacterized protein n=1 Tax=Brassica napus TaxID=3708 RepID=A0ABQ7Y7M9_BRANA|nr:hypothetical protein HID58_081426 [Brassica napus]